MGRVQRLGILHHPQAAAARELADEIRLLMAAEGITSWLSTPLDEALIAASMPATDLMICVGGDGTVLTAARSVHPRALPILGINMGRLGFLCELAPAEALPRLPEVLLGHYRVERLTMLAAELPAELSLDGPLYALNDVVVSRGAVGRPVVLTLCVDGHRLVQERADGMIVASATGSTGYNLSAGGPVLAPETREIVVTAIAPHLSRFRPIVLPAESVLTLSVESEHGAIVSLDGQVNRPLPGGSTLQIRRSPHEAHLVRLGPPAHFYTRLNHYLDTGARE